MEISKPLMSPTYLNGINDDRRPDSPRSPTKSAMPITPGLQPPTPYTPYAPDTSNYSSATTYTSNTPGTYPPSAGYSSNGSTVFGSGGSTGYVSPVTPRRDRNDEEMTPRLRSNSATEKEVEKEQPAQTQSSRSETNTRRRERKDVNKKDVSKKDVSNPMKSFRVNLDDPCWKVLPAAMKKYEVKGREEDYRLYITYENTGIHPPLQFPRVVYLFHRQSPLLSSNLYLL